MPEEKKRYRVVPDDGAWVDGHLRKRGDDGPPILMTDRQAQYLVLAGSIELDVENPGGKLSSVPARKREAERIADQNASDIALEDKLESEDAEGRLTETEGVEKKRPRK